MKIKLSSLWVYALAIVPLFILVAVEGTFNMQSVWFPMVLLCIGACFKNDGVVGLSTTDTIIILIFLLTNMASMIVNIFTLQNPQWIYLIRIAYFAYILVFYFIGTRYKITNDDIDMIFNFNIFSGIVISMYFLFVNKIWYTNLLGITIDKNFSGAMISIQGEMALIQFFRANLPRKKVLYFLAYIFIVMGVFFTASRASMLVIIGGTVLLSCDWVFFISRNKHQYMRFAVITIIGIICIGFLLYQTRGMFLSNMKTNWYWERYFANTYADASNAHRLDLWKAALDLWVKRPIFGYGIGMSTPDGMSSVVAHNTYIDYLTDQGIFGLVGFIMVWYQSASMLWKGNKKYRAIVISVFLHTIILSATRSVLLWYFLVLFRLIGNMDSTYRNWTSESLTNVQTNIGGRICL